MKPDNVTFEQAASAPVAAFTALQGLRDKGQIQPGQKVLINGAAGGVGTFAVQIASWFGGEVTGVCSTRNVDLVRFIGADRSLITPKRISPRVATLRPNFRLRWEPFVVSLQARLKSRGDMHHGRRQDRSGDGRYIDPFDYGGCVVKVREPKVRHVSSETEQRRPDHHARSHEGRKGDTRYRQALQIK